MFQLNSHQLMTPRCPVLENKTSQDHHPSTSVLGSCYEAFVLACYKSCDLFRVWDAAPRVFYFLFCCNSSYFGVNLSLLGRMAAVLNASPFRIMDLTWIGNGFKILLRLMGSNNCVTKTHHCHRPECTSPAKRQSLCFNRGAHTCWWSVNQMHLISSTWQWLRLLCAVGEVRVW